MNDVVVIIIVSLLVACAVVFVYSRIRPVSPVYSCTGQPGLFCAGSSKFPGVCPPGYVCPGDGTGSISPCPAGSYCPPGAGKAVPCPAGSGCAARSVGPVPCPAKTYCPKDGMVGPDALKCTPGFYCPEGTITPEDCPAGSFCPEGTDVPIACSTGGPEPERGKAIYCPPKSSSRGTCPEKAYCPDAAQKIACPPETPLGGTERNVSSCVSSLSLNVLVNMTLNGSSIVNGNVDISKIKMMKDPLYYDTSVLPTKSRGIISVVEFFPHNGSSSPKVSIIPFKSNDGSDNANILFPPNAVRERMMETGQGQFICPPGAVVVDITFAKNNVSFIILAVYYKMLKTNVRTRPRVDSRTFMDETNLLAVTGAETNMPIKMLVEITHLDNINLTPLFKS